MNYPPVLQPGDRVGVTAPASKINYQDALNGINILRNDWKLEVVEGATLTSSANQFSASDEVRAAELQSMLDDPTLRAIFAARGGYGCSKIIDRLDFTGFSASPKWIVGFSDVTTFLMHLNRLGYATIHGPMVKNLAETDGYEAVASLKKLLFEGTAAYRYAPHPLNRQGAARGEVTGGNLCLLAHLIGSASETDTEDKILFLEDVGEYHYALDRLMVQLKRAGKLSGLKALVAGQFTELKDQPESSFGHTAEEIIRNHTREYSYPLAFNFPAGHVADNRALCFGKEADLYVGPDEVRLSF